MCVITQEHGHHHEHYHPNEVTEKDAILELIRRTLAEELESVNTVVARRVAIADEKVKEHLNDVIKLKKSTIIALVKIMCEIDEDFSALPDFVGSD